MSTFRATPERMRELADEITRLNTLYNDQITMLNTEVVKLGSSWTSPSFATYKSVFDRKATYLEDGSQLMKTYISFLNGAAINFEETEQGIDRRLAE